ncbi:MAG: hypothetical protein LBE09_03140 [Christensenellaceae bacterium]|jgi:hypothetical protein|nr:hypothetical protein [Christensenellaceae bacterium]
MRKAVRIRQLFVVFLCALVLLLAIALTACNNPPDDPVEPDDTSDIDQGGEVTNDPITPIKVLNKLISGTQIATNTSDGYNFNIEGESYFKLPRKDEADIDLNLKIKASFDLDVDNKTSANNLYIFELSKKSNDKLVPLFYLYYKDSLDETPYIFANIAGVKHAIKATSVKNLLVNGSPGLFGPLAKTQTSNNEEWNFQSLLDSFSLGDFAPLVDLFLLKGSNSIISNPYISEDGTSAGFKLDMGKIKKLVLALKPLIENVSGLRDTVDDVFKLLSIDMSYAKLLSILENLPPMDISLDAKFSANGALEDIQTKAKFINDTEIKLDFDSGANIFDFTVPSGESVEFGINGLKVYAGTPAFTTLPEEVNLTNYSAHNLINFELNGVARIEYLKEIDANRKEIWNASKAFEYTVIADLNPFAIFNGVDAKTLESTIKSMGKFNIYVIERSESSQSQIAEIAFDPANSNDDGLYVSILLQGIGTLAGTQTMRFDISDLIEYILDTPSTTETIQGLQNAEGDSSQDPLAIINTIKGVLHSIGFKIHTGDSRAPFAISFKPSKIEALSEYTGLLLGNAGERLYIGANEFNYGTVDSSVNLFDRFNKSSSYAVSFTPHESVLTEYEYGQAFQNGYSTIDMNVIYSSNGTLDETATRKSLKVIKMRGFDTSLPGEQTVELYLIAPPKSISSLFGAPIYDAFASANLPYGIMKYEYKITVKEKDASKKFILSSDNIYTGDSIFNVGIREQNGELVSDDRLKTFTLYAIDSEGAQIEAINASGIAEIVGKYYLKGTTRLGASIEQTLYINKIILPDLDAKLIQNAPTSDLNAITFYYDEEQKTVVEVIVPVAQKSSTTTYVDVRGDKILGNGVRPNMGSESVSAIKWTYKIGTNGGVSEREIVRDRLAVKFSEPLIKIVSMPKITIYDDLKFVNLGSVLRSDGSTTYHINTDEGSGLRWINGRYQIWDADGNVIADAVIIQIKLGEEDVTDKYYDAVTGKIKIRSDADGNPILSGTTEIPGLKLTVTVKHGKLSDSITGNISIYPKYRLLNSALSVKQYNPLPYTAFRVYAYNNVTDSYGSYFETKLNYSSGYFVNINNKIYPFTVQFYTTNDEIVENGLTEDYKIALPVGKYKVKLSMTVDGVVIENTSNLTVSATTEYKVKTGNKISTTRYLHLAHPVTNVIGSSGTFQYGTSGYQFVVDKYLLDINLSDIGIYSEGKKLETADVFDADNNVKLVAGRYEIIINVPYPDTNGFSVKGVLVVS